MNSFDYDLIAKVLSGEATASEADRLQEGCATDPALQAAFSNAQAVWALTEKAMPRFSVDKAAAWQKIQARIGGEAATDIPEAAPASKRVALPVWTRWAAAAAVVALGATLLLRQQAETPQTVVAATARQQVILSDGSTVTLGKNARLQYAASFEKGQRHVSLQGQAFFEVTKDAQHPFTIDADGLQVTVLGTSFLVNATAGEVAVRTGKVKVAQVQSQREVVLKAGEGAQVATGILQKETADSNDYFLKTGRMVFQAKPFEEIIRSISRILEVPVQVDASIPTAGRTQAVTYTAAVSSAESVLTDLCRITGYQWRKEGEGYRIFQAH